MVEVKKGTKSFYIGDSEENPLAEMAFVPSGNSLIIIDHTHVSEELNYDNVKKELKRLTIQR